MNGKALSIRERTKINLEIIGASDFSPPYRF